MPITYKRISAKKSDRDAWIRSTSTCLAKGPVLLPSGEDRTTVEARGEIGKLGDGDVVRFCVWNTGRWSDLVWTGDMILIASDRLIDALEALEVQAFTTFPILVKDEQGNRIPGYQGFTPSELDREAEIHSFHPDSPHYAFAMSERVVNELRNRGVDGFEVDQMPF